MRRILFVDDEPNILEGLQRMLRPLRGEWEMAFAESGQAALGRLAAQAFDVVVSDMRMPGMSGAQLLNEVRERYPQTVRIILSGYADQDLALKSVESAHQYIAKPCEAEMIKVTVNRTCALRDLLADRQLQRLVSQLRSLPSLPSLYTELLAELQSSAASLRRVGEIIAQDVGMTAKILQMVNSAFFGLRRQVSNAVEAVSLLGLETVMTLVLTIRVFSQFDRTRLPGVSPEHIYAHSLQVGLFAKRIAQAERASAEVVNDAFAAGLLHDVGQLVMIANLPQQYAQVLELARVKQLTYDAAEGQVFGATHAEVGAYLLGLWGLPEAIVEAVAFHHHPRLCLVQGFGALAAVHAANALEQKTQVPGTEACPVTLDLSYLTKLNRVERLPVWRGLCAQAAASGG